MSYPFTNDNFNPTTPPGSCTACPCPQPTLGLNSAPAGSDVSNCPGVSLSLGQLKFPLDLISVAGLGGGSWSFGLQYLSGADISTLTGLGFNFTQNPVLTMSTVTQDVTITSGDNTQEVFEYNSSNNSYSSAGNNTASNLVRSGSGATDVFTLTSPSGNVAVYSGVASGVPVPGQLLSVTDRYGNGQSFTWAMTGGVAQLLSVTDSYGRTAAYSYYGSEYNYLLQQIEDYQGRQVNFQYDDSSRLLAVVLPSINQAAAGNTFPNGTAYVFQYDSTNPGRSGRMILSASGIPIRRRPS